MKVQTIRPSIDGDDLEQCGRLAVRLGVSVAEIREAINQFGGAIDAAALGLEKRRDRRRASHLKSESWAPTIGILSDSLLARGEHLFAAPSIAVEAIIEVAGGIPRVLPVAASADVDAYLDGLDGVLLPGGQSNVHPSRYGKAVNEKADGPFDEDRDTIALQLIPRALARGIPALFVCRGFQELNVAFGGTLKKEPSDIPSERQHGTPEADTEDERYRLRQELAVSERGILRAICGCDKMLVNSLHSFVIDALAPALQPEAFAEDGTVEAVSVRDAPGFALGTAFHPDYWASSDPTSAKLISAFGRAARDHAAARRHNQGMTNAPV